MLSITFKGIVLQKWFCYYWLILISFQTCKLFLIYNFGLADLTSFNWNPKYNAIDVFMRAVHRLEKNYFIHYQMVALLVIIGFNLNCCFMFCLHLCDGNMFCHIVIDCCIQHREWIFRIQGFHSCICNNLVVVSKTFQNVHGHNHHCFVLLNCSVSLTKNHCCWAVSLGKVSVKHVPLKAESHTHKCPLQHWTVCSWFLPSVTWEMTSC